jgi:TRAP-type mannitol/chloroaromatic compound transport system substrate-binding protein
MNRRLSFAVAFAGLVFAAATQASAQEKPVRWKMASVVPGNLPHFGEGSVRLEKTIDLISGGTIQIKHFDPGALVPALQIFDAVSSGAVDAGYSGSGYWAGKVPAAAFFNSVPFGPGIDEFLAWIRVGGGQQIWDEIYAKHNLKALPCLMAPPEPSMWVRKEIKSLDDLKGMKLRYFGLGALVMQRLGATTQVLPAGETAQAFERGMIDGLENSTATLDLQVGLSRIAKHIYFPGWHQQASSLELMMHKPRWDALSDRQKRLIEVACNENITWSITVANISQVAAIEAFKKQGVTIHRWTPEQIATFKKQWDAVVEERAAQNADFKKAWESLKAFRARYAEWNSIGYLRD